MSFSEAQFKALAIAPKVTASLSMCGSSIILSDIFLSKEKRQFVYHRIILSLSIMDVVISVSTFLSTWPMPSDTAYVWGAAGTQGTCTAQGFFLQLAIVGPLYNAVLSLYYLLMIKYNWSERRLRTLRIPIHATILTFGTGAAVAGLFLKLYNNALLWCWQASYPPGCVESAASPTGETTCTRGDNANTIYRWAFFYGPLWGAILFATFATVLTFLAVRKTLIQAERKLKQQRSVSLSVTLANSLQPSRGNRRADRGRKVLVQSVLYLGSFYLTWAPATVMRILQTLGRPVPYGLLLSVSVSIPVQGFFNAFVYLRPKYQSYRKLHPDHGIAWVLRKITQEVIRPNREDTGTRFTDYNVADEKSERYFSVAEESSGAGAGMASVSSAEEGGPQNKESADKVMEAQERNDAFDDNKGPGEGSRRAENQIIESKLVTFTLPNEGGSDHEDGAQP